jgi:putative ABC transport system ATP-binding protein
MSGLALRGVVKRYPSGGETVCAANGVTLEVEPGELIALYGPSGSGKTTLLLLASGLMAPDLGKVVFDGRDVGGMSARESARYRLHDVGFVFQSFHLMPGVERLGLGDRLEHRPEQLSMGERQRVAIARALVGEPRLLLADEPTGNLDSARTREILALLRDVCHERGIPGLLVTHDAEAIPFVDRTLTLRDGCLLEGLDAELAELSS